MSTDRRPLHVADWIMFAATIAVSIGIGIFFACTGAKQKTVNEYLVANRQLSLIPAALSMFMSLVSAVYVLGQTAEVYFHGAQIWVGQIGTILGYTVTAVLYVPLFYRIKIISQFEYLARRYGTDRKGYILRMTLVIISITTRTMYMGIAMFTPATALEAGFPYQATLVLMGVITCFYTTIGGIKAVVWTDAFQGLVLFAGIISILISGAIRVGGMSRVWQIAGEHGRLNFWNFNPDPTKRMTFWSAAGGNFILSILVVGTTQNNVQRYCALPTLTKARLAVVLVAFFFTTALSILVLSALVMFAYFTEQGCDPLRGRKIYNQNQIMPYFISHVLGYPGLTGVYLAVIFSGALSSLSSSMSGLSAVTWRELLQTRFRKFSEAKKAFVLKIMVLCFGATAILLSFIVQYLPGHILQVTLRLTAAMASPITGVVTLGALTACANSVGAVVGAITAFAFTSVINIGAYINPPHRATLSTIVTNCTFDGNATAAPVPTDPPGGFPLFKLSFQLVGLVGIVTTVVVGGIVSIATGGEKKERCNLNYMVRWNNYLCCCCPASVKGKLVCGATYQEDINPYEDQESKEKQTNQLERKDMVTFGGSQVSPVDNKTENVEPLSYQSTRF